MLCQRSKNRTQINMALIIPRIFGGLGNQLFCYAAARRLALANNAELVIDDVSGFVRDHNYLREYQLDHFNIPCRKATPAERLEPFSQYRRYLKRWLNRKLPFEERSYIMQEGINFDPRLLQVKPYNKVYLEGYWQSEDYFKDVQATIRSELEIKPPTDEVNRTMADQIRDTLAVAVHVRFFDAPSQEGTNNAPEDYYARAVAQMETLTSGAHYFVFSDRPDAARTRIPLPDARVTCVAHNQGDVNAYADLWLMSQCCHFIIANSTFSWWGAWLGEKLSSVVISPGQVMGTVTAWAFPGLLPNRWLSLK
jgi:hypothetical protein